MDFHNITAPVYRALEITERYFSAIPDAPADAQKKARENIIRLFNDGEERPLALANRAIAEVERERQARAVTSGGMYDGAA